MPRPLQPASLARHASRILHSRLSSTSAAPLLRPVGALTSKPYAFTARSWELKSIDSVDVLDGLGSNIRVDIRGTDIMRVLPRLNEDVNEEWISDKARFSYDGLKRQRLDAPMIKSRSGDLITTDWPTARFMLRNVILSLDRKHPAGYRASAIVGPTVDVRSAAALRAQFLAHFPGGDMHVAAQPPGVSTDFRAAYKMNSGVAGVEQADVCLLVGANPRREAPVFNARIRKAVIHGGLRVASVGAAMDLTYGFEHLGVSTKTLKALVEGKHPWASVIQEAERPMVVVSNQALLREDGAAIHEMLYTFCKKNGVITDEWNGFNVLHQGANAVGLMDIGFDSKDAAPTGFSDTKFLYLLAADDLDNVNIPDDCFVVYQGHHGDAGASRADLILPGAAYTEKSATYVNTEGRPQQANVVFFPPGAAMDDADLLHALPGPYLSPLSGLPAAGLDVLAPHLAEVGELAEDVEAMAGGGKGGVMFETPLAEPVEDFYLTDPISRSSVTMAKCSRVVKVSNFD